MKLNYIFISHFHADHISGLGGLIQTMDLFRRTKKLSIYGPTGITEVIEKIITTGHFILEGFDLEINEVKAKKPVQIVAEKGFSITAATLNHGVPTLGYLFKEDSHRKFLQEKALKLGIPRGPLFKKLQQGEDIVLNDKIIHPDQVLGEIVEGKKIAYISDSRPCSNTIKITTNADILIHEATLTHDQIDSATKGMHSTAKEAAEIAKKAKVKQLYCYHISQRYKEGTKILNEARKIFKNSKVAQDFEKLYL